MIPLVSLEKYGDPRIDTLCNFGGRILTLATLPDVIVRSSFANKKIHGDFELFAPFLVSSSHETFVRSFVRSLKKIAGFGGVLWSIRSETMDIYIWRGCGERKWANGWRKIPLLYGAIIRLHIRYYCCFMEGYSIYIGTTSTLYCRRAIIILLPGNNNSQAERARARVGEIRRKSRSERKKLNSGNAELYAR